METSPSQGVEVPMLADQDFEDMFLADTQARLGRVTLREHDYVAPPPPTPTQVSCHISQLLNVSTKMHHHAKVSCF